MRASVRSLKTPSVHVGAELLNLRVLMHFWAPTSRLGLTAEAPSLKCLREETGNLAMMQNSLFGKGEEQVRGSAKG